MLNENDIIAIGRESVWVMLKVGAPMMLTALVVGLIVSLIQALTQIQEMTLTFVPKILAMFVVLVLSIPFMLQSMIDYTNALFVRISGIGL